MRRNAALVCLLALTAACGGGGGGSSGPDSTSAATAADNTATTEAATTTIAAEPLAEDATLVAGLPAVAEFTFTASEDGPADFAFLTADTEATSGVLNRYAVASATKSGSGAGMDAGHVLLLGVDPAFPLSGVEDGFLDDLESIVPDEVGGTAEAIDVSIESAIGGKGTDLAWSAFYHEGVGYVVWAPTDARRDALAEALVIALHAVAPFTTLEQMEGPDLAGKFTALAPPCTWTAMPADLLSAEDQLAAANTWREGDMPLAQHWAVRNVMCDNASGQLVIVQMHPEFAGHDWGRWYMEHYDASHQQGTVELQGITAYLYDGALRWIQGDYYYQLSTHYMRRSNGSTTWPAFDAASLQAIATQLIQTAAATTPPTGDTTPGTVPEGTQTVAEVAALLGCTNVQLIATEMLAVQTGTCTYKGSLLQISTYTGETYLLPPSCAPGEVVSSMHTDTVMISGKDAAAVIAAAKVLGVPEDQSMTVMAC